MKASIEKWKQDVTRELEASDDLRKAKDDHQKGKTKHD